MTGLPNRALALLRLAEALQECLPDQRVAVAFCDLDGFKSINDAYGHAAGDVVLEATAARLRAMVRPTDTAARLAGDEFCLVLRYLPPMWDGDKMRARIADQLAQPVPILDLLIATSASIGLIVAHPGSQPADRDADHALARADQAMYRHKSGRRRSDRPA